MSIQVSESVSTLVLANMLIASSLIATFAPNSVSVRDYAISLYTDELLLDADVERFGLYRSGPDATGTVQGVPVTVYGPRVNQ